MKERKYSEAIEEVRIEVARAKSMFKNDFHNQHEGYAVILEELDELWEEIKKNQRDYDISAQRKEAVQCAAMCIRFIAELTSDKVEAAHTSSEGDRFIGKTYDEILNNFK